MFYLSCFTECLHNLYNPNNRLEKFFVNKNLELLINKLVNDNTRNEVEPSEPL